MRYISKGAQPAIITNYINERKLLGLAIDYDGTFLLKRELNDLLREKQKNICCYCQQSIDHFNNPCEAGSHNEHLVPQSGAPALQLAYSNLFACCNYTKDYVIKKDKYCGWHKEDELIKPFIQNSSCRDFFKYNTIGEILPNGSYDLLQDYIDNKLVLPMGQAEALDAIITLNLNQAVLREQRRKTITDWIALLATQGLTAAGVPAKITKLMHAPILPPFVEALIYFLRQVK
jgi:uncharacterized protein (TIGR02646 family)